jgi:hypothetical protein
MTTEMQPETLVECPLCEGPITVEPSAVTLTCAACRVSMDLTPDTPVGDRATQPLAAAA